MDRELIFSILAFLISVIDLSFFWAGIVRKHIIPHPFTFFIWSVVLSISFIELIRRNEWFGAFAVSVVTLSCFFALLVGIHKWHTLKINWMDWFFLVSGILLIIFWQVEPHYAYVVVVMIAIDATAYASSFKKAWLQPWTEKSLPYFISVGSYVCTILSISLWNFENLGMWIWTACINFGFACFILARQYSMRK